MDTAATPVVVNLDQLRKDGEPVAAVTSYGRLGWVTARHMARTP